MFIEPRLLESLRISLSFWVRMAWNWTSVEKAWGLNIDQSLYYSMLFLQMRTDYEYIGPHHAHATGHSRVVQNTFLYSFEYLSANNPWPQWMGKYVYYPYENKNGLLIYVKQGWIYWVAGPWANNKQKWSFLYLVKLYEMNVTSCVNLRSDCNPSWVAHDWHMLWHGWHTTNTFMSGTRPTHSTHWVTHDRYILMSGTRPAHSWVAPYQQL